MIGALQALYGPAIPALRDEFGISPAVAGLSLSAHFVGALLGVLIYHLLRGRLNNRVLLGGSYVLMAAGAAAFAFSPSWALASPAPSSSAWASAASTTASTSSSPSASATAAPPCSTC